MFYIRPATPPIYFFIEMWSIKIKKLSKGEEKNGKKGERKKKTREKRTNLKEKSINTREAFLNAHIIKIVGTK